MRRADESHPNPGSPIPDGSGHVPIVSRKAVTIGLCLSAAVLAGMALWRLAPSLRVEKELTEFEFTVEEPKKEEIDIGEPMRPLNQTQSADLMAAEQNVAESEVLPLTPDERPTVRVAITPVAIATIESTVSFKSIDVAAVDVVADVSGGGVDVDGAESIAEMIDTSEGGGGVGEAGETFETVDLQLDTMIAKLPGTDEIFQYGQPTPTSRTKSFTWTRGGAPPVRAMNALGQIFGGQASLTMGELGTMNISMFGGGEFFRSMTRLGGVHARAAVDAALSWLAARQEGDGYWTSQKYEGTDSPVEATGMTLLAFMGGGQTTRRGEYRRQVTKGLEWLLKQQRPDGSVGNTVYEHALATLAFSEAFGRAQDERMQAAAQRAVEWIERVQLPDGGWGFQQDSQNGDMLVTAWVVQALKAAKLAQIGFDMRIQAQALAFVDRLTDKGAGPGTTGAVAESYDKAQAVPENSFPTLTCAAMLVRLFGGIGVRSEVLAKGAVLTRAQAPDWNRKDFGLWYYGTYAMHYMGEEDRIWWNKRMRDVLVESQVRQGEHTGSWDPKGERWSRSGGGRIYSTVMGALCLEVYYRYSDALNSFGIAPDLDDLFTQ